MPVTNRSAGAQAGDVKFFAGSAAPPGWFKANGATVSRTAYAALFAVIGTTYGAGDGVATFALPDYRAEFLRCADDGRGVDAGRQVGTAQAYQVHAHDHPQKHAQTGATGGTSWPSWAYSGGGSPGELGGAVTGVYGGSETRPRNVAVLACIKY